MQNQSKQKALDFLNSNFKDVMYHFDPKTTNPKTKSTSKQLCAAFKCINKTNPQPKNEFYAKNGSEMRLCRTCRQYYGFRL